MGSSTVSAFGAGGQSLAISNVNGQVSVEVSHVINGTHQRFKLEGSEAEIRSQLKQLPSEASQRVLDAIGE